MFTKFLETYIRLSTMTTSAKEEGQGTLEYVGIVVVAGILVLAVIAGLGEGTTITNAITTGIAKVTGAGAAPAGPAAPN